MQYRTIWISDFHLGTRGCNAGSLLDFLRDNDAETIYLVGDIIDGWRLRKRVYWPQSHNDVVQKLLRKARKGTRVVYIPGNHDEFLRAHVPVAFGEIEIVEEIEHLTADGRRLLVIHGDEFDGVTTYHRWVSLLGDSGYTFALFLNRGYNFGRRACGLPQWSLSAFLKHQVKRAVAFISNYEDALSRECKRRKFDGVVCGHIHHAEIRSINGVLYCNTGDWVESLTALVEDFAGNLSLVRSI